MFYSVEYASDTGTFDSVGTTKLQDAGKAGLVMTIQGKNSAVLGSALICAYLFITLFPDQAEKLLQMSLASSHCKSSPCYILLN
ncbi:Polyadenylate-binding 2 [Gossypium australe]|uniref:Polyadenylate-binding 2 n=1 Tax=Gossypium australe TaxID=47621 RepID=A0A5B6WAG8_9ROSI|nr:Polyadenylate-binding 2 [Gossypium australe]